MSTYQLQARSAGSGGWFPATVSPVGWRLLLGMVALWRRANPGCELRGAVPWSEAITFGDLR